MSRSLLVILSKAPGTFIILLSIIFISVEWFYPNRVTKLSNDLTMLVSHIYQERFPNWTVSL